MPSTKRRPRSALFSLSARMERRAKLTPVIDFEPDGDAESHDMGDDGCPVCVAARTGLASVAQAMANPPPALLAEVARRTLAKTKIGTEEVLELMSTGRMMPDGSYEMARYVLDAAGRVFRETNGQRKLVASTSAS
jgi:hypothetical protein